MKNDHNPARKGSNGTPLGPRPAPSPNPPAPSRTSRAIDVMVQYKNKAPEQWTSTRPSKPGIYAVRGPSLHGPRIVSVREISQMHEQRVMGEVDMGTVRTPHWVSMWEPTFDGFEWRFIGDLPR